MKDTVEVESLPYCDICNEMRVSEGHVTIERAIYDAKSIYGSWAYMCQKHFDQIGVGLGLGKGQKLVLKAKGTSKEYEEWLETHNEMDTLMLAIKFRDNFGLTSEEASSIVWNWKENKNKKRG